MRRNAIIPNVRGNVDTFIKIFVFVALIKCELLGNRITELPASFITALNQMEQRLT